jgi:leader peptidase (prepilin peptidase) / N-methyltransferase
MGILPDELLKTPFTAWPIEWTAGVFLIVGVCLGNLLARWMLVLTPAEFGRTIDVPPCPCRRRWRLRIPLLGHLIALRRCRRCGRSICGWTLASELATGLLFAGFVIAYLHFGCQNIPEVIPDESWQYARIFYHLTLIALLIAATGTDLRDYVIPDGITGLGVLIGLSGAALSGQLQMIHLWIDWNLELPGIGPYIPEWIKQHMHLHGVAWSLAGLAVGGGITWLVRATSSYILGREALGLGDVTLMAMIGSFLGWQPVLFVFLLAPLCGIVVSLAVRLLTSRTFVPFGPYLSLAAIVVLGTWRWLWTPTREIFGHWPSLATLGGVAFTALVVLLGLVRLYRMIPGKRRDASAEEATESDEQVLLAEEQDADDRETSLPSPQSDDPASGAT